MNKNQIEKLIEKNYTRGLAQSLNLTKQSFALRIWIIDNSRSMLNSDGNRMVDTYNSYEKVEMVPCTRWEEIRECVNYHIQLAETVQAPTTFRFLNKPINAPQRFDVGGAVNSNETPCTAKKAIKIMKKVRPEGCTPLTSHIREIQREVTSMAPLLRKKGQRVSITIATDGLPTNERGYRGSKEQKKFVDSLRGLEGLPVWVVIRLCTDEESVVSFYNDLDSVLELSIEVLDDFVAEAKEVYVQNPWLNYSLTIHRLREMGYHDRIFDMLDERRLTKTELRDFCLLLFGEDNFDGVPDPSFDWVGFINRIEMLQEKENSQWNPIRNRAKPWISIKKLNQIYGNSINCVIM